MKTNSSLWLIVILAAFLGGCSSKGIKDEPPAVSSEHPRMAQYLIGTGDTLNIFVWRHPEVSLLVPVRPDGQISTPLVEDVVAVGKTPTQLARDIEEVLGVYIKQPRVTVIITGFGTISNQQIRVIGEAAQPQALRFVEDVSLLDVMIDVGGLTEFAAGNDASIVRTVDGQQKKFQVRLDDLIKKGDLSANVQMMPGDILIIPEAWF